MSNKNGTNNNDTITGTTSSDKIDGKKGNDLLYGLGGNDELIGGEGNDLLEGGEGNDELKGDKGTDTLNGGAGRDFLAGGDDNDTLSGGGDDDLLDGGKGNDALSGNEGNDILAGYKGNDTLLGGNGDDILLGDGKLKGSGKGWGDDASGSGSGASAGSGKSSDDSSWSEWAEKGSGGSSANGDGNDYLDGGAGNDRLFGWSGKDTGRYKAAENVGAADKYDGGSGIDTLQLELTLAEWMDPAFQGDLANYLQFLDAHTNTKTGQADNAAFAFNAFGLTASAWEKLEVTVDGTSTNPVDEAIVAKADKLSTNEETAISGNVLLNNGSGADLIPDYLRATTLVTGPAGTLALASNGSFAYDPSKAYQSLAAGQKATDTFTYQIEDADGDTSTATVSIEVTGVNDAPTMASGSLAAVEDGAPVSLSLSALGDDIDSDNDGSNLAYSLVSVAPGGAASITGTTLSYAPGTDFQSLALGQTKSFDLDVKATDAHGASATNTVSVTVTGVNDAPTLLAGSASVVEDGAAATVDLSALGDDIDSDNDGSNLAYSLVSVAPGGAASITGTTLSYGPGSDFQSLALSQTKSFNLDVKATDAHGASALNTVAVTVTGVNDAPTMAAGSLNAVEDGAPVSLSLAALGDDIDSDNDGSNLAYALVSVAPGGAASITGTTLSYAPGTDFQLLALGQTKSFDLDVKATDVHGASASNTVSVTVTGVNDAPTLLAGSASIIEDGAAATVDLSALGNDIDSDNDGSNLTYSLVGAAPGGIASITGSTLSVSAGSDFQSLALGQTKSFNLDVKATDAHGASALNTVAVTVTGVNDAPEIVAGSDAAGAVTAKVALPPFTVQQYSGYRSTVLADLQAYASSNAASYTVTTNVIDYTDDPAGFAGEIPGSMPWPAAQSTGATGVAHPLNDNFFVRITGQFTVDVADTYTFRTFNDDGAFLKVNNTLLISDSGIHPESAFSGSIALTPGQYSIELFFFEFGGEASLEFSYRNSTGVFGLVDPNPALKDSGVLLFNDVDLTDAHTVAVAPAGSTLGSLTAAVTTDTTGSGTGGQVKWNYSVNNDSVKYLGAGDTKVETFTVTVNDGKGGTDSQQVDVTITGVNDVAVLGNAVANLVETDAPLSAGGTLSISDVDTGEAVFTVQNGTAGTYGNFSIAANGVWSFASNGALDVLADGQVVTDVFNVTSADGTATTVSVSITGTADGPTGVNDSNAIAASTVVPNNSNTVYWVDWQSAQLLGGTVNDDKYVKVSGTITLGDGHTIGVTYEGLAWLVLLAQGQPAPGLVNYNSPTSEFIEPDVNNRPYTSAQVNAAPTGWDIIGLNEAFSGGGSQTGSRTDFSPRNLTFSEPVENLFFAVMSMNLNGYLFDQNFQIVSQGRGKYGDAPDISPTSFGGGQYGIVSTGEFHGVLKIDGSVEELTWTSQNKETWNGFTVGTYGQSQTSTASGNVLSNDDPGAVNAVIEVSAVGGNGMVGNSVTLTMASGATLRIDRDGDYFYDDNGKFASLGAGQSNTDSVVYTVRDAQGNTDTATLSIVVNGVNDRPVAVNDAFGINEDNTLTITAGQLLANDTDRDTGDTRSLVSVQGAVNGTVSLSGSTVSFIPKANFSGNASFTYTMQDAAGLSSTATVNVAVSQVSDVIVVSNLVSNGSFEPGIASWTALWGGIDVVNTWQRVDGNNVIDLNAFERGGLSQTLATTAGQTYTLGFNLSQNPGADVSVVRVVTGATYQDFTFNQDSTPSDMKWSHQILTFTAAGTSTELSFNSLTPSAPLGFPDDAEGPALDEVYAVANRAVNGFVKGAGADVLNMSQLMTSINAPHDATAFSGGFVRFLASGADTVVQIDADGGGNEYVSTVTLVGVSLTQGDTSNYVL